MKMARAGFLALLVLLLSACWSGAAPGKKRSEPASKPAPVEFAGTVVFVPLEGGFYGLVSADGKRYDPVGSLPAGLRKNGMKVWVRGLLTGPAAGVHMWGKKIRIIRIEPR
jgi:hypothetical protein